MKNILNLAMKLSIANKKIEELEKQIFDDQNQIKECRKEINDYLKYGYLYNIRKLYGISDRDLKIIEWHFLTEDEKRKLLNITEKTKNYDETILKIINKFHKCSNYGDLQKTNILIEENIKLEKKYFKCRICKEEFVLKTYIPFDALD